jgi:hypothetical protein
MAVEVSGKLDGRAVEAVWTGAGDLTGDKELLGTAIEEVKRGAVVSIGHPYPSAEASFGTPFAFAITVGSCLDNEAAKIKGLTAADIPSDDALTEDDGPIDY